MTVAVVLNPVVVEPTWHASLPSADAQNVVSVRIIGISAYRDRHVSKSFICTLTFCRIVAAAVPNSWRGMAGKAGVQEGVPIGFVPSSG